MTLADFFSFAKEPNSYFNFCHLPENTQFTSVSVDSGLTKPKSSFSNAHILRFAPPLVFPGLKSTLTRKLILLTYVYCTKENCASSLMAHMQSVLARASLIIIVTVQFIDSGLLLQNHATGLLISLHLQMPEEDFIGTN